MARKALLHNRSKFIKLPGEIHQKISLSLDKSAVYSYARACSSINHDLHPILIRIRRNRLRGKLALKKWKRYRATINLIFEFFVDVFEDKYENTSLNLENPHWCSCLHASMFLVLLSGSYGPKYTKRCASMLNPVVKFLKKYSDSIHEHWINYLRTVGPEFHRYVIDAFEQITEEDGPNCKVYLIFEWFASKQCEFIEEISWNADVNTDNDDILDWINLKWVVNENLDRFKKTTCKQIYTLRRICYGILNDTDLAFNGNEEDN